MHAVILAAGEGSRLGPTADDRTRHALAEATGRPLKEHGGAWRQVTAAYRRIGREGALQVEAAGCTRCGLYANATQVVMGEGPEDAEMMIVGEQPGDREDLAGRPFVGPAGQLFDEVAERAGLDRRVFWVLPN